MCCIEAARKQLEKDRQLLRNRGFKPEEAEFLSGIEVEDYALLAFATIDLGRLWPKQRKELDARFPGLSRKKGPWTSSSTWTTSIPIQEACVDRIEETMHFNELSGHFEL